MQASSITHAEALSVMIPIIGGLLGLLISLIGLYARQLEKRIAAVEAGKQDKKACDDLHEDLEGNLSRGDGTFGALTEAVNTLSVRVYLIARGLNELLPPEKRIPIREPNTVPLRRG
ncbi:MAG: hypothetical protein AB1921_16045 [Thermodesulfobacteriota bacterium]